MTMDNIFLTSHHLSARKYMDIVRTINFLSEMVKESKRCIFLRRNSV